MTQNILWDVDRLKKAIGDDLIHIDDDYNYKIDSVVFDNRAVSEYSLFIAKKGENTDGHNFIEETLNKNPHVVVLANYGYSEKFNNNSRIILVKDTIEAMEKMAKYARDTVSGKVFGITGSVGKTTTKELFHDCLSNFGNTYCNTMSFNNYFGVMTTLCNLPQNIDYAIIEMGMNSRGEMEKLSEIVQPDITAILNITSAHLAFFKDEKDIAYSKSEIFRFQKKGGFAILNRDSDYIDIMTDEAKRNNISSILTFSEKGNLADVVLKEYYYNDNIDKYIASYEIEGKTIDFSFNTPDYNVAINLMSLLAAMKGLNLDFNKIKKTVEEFGTPRGRNNIEEIIFDEKHITIINGTYNAVNPLVFIRGLELMDKIAKRKKINRKIAIFGDIKEAGNKSEEFMLSLRQPILESKIDILIGVGDIIESLCNSLKNDIEVKYFKDSSAVVPLIKNLLMDNDLLFIKGSKSIKTWKILDEITGYPTEIYI